MIKQTKYFTAVCDCCTKDFSINAHGTIYKGNRKDLMSELSFAGWKESGKEIVCDECRRVDR